MWFLFHGKTRTQPVAGGRSLVDDCPACHAQARFHEVEVTTSAGAFFVDVAASTDRGFRCGACGEVFDLRADLDRAAADSTSPPPPTTRAGTPIPRPGPARDLLAQLEAESAERAAIAPQRDAAIDAELAALKRKLGK